MRGFPFPNLGRRAFLLGSAAALTFADLSASSASATDAPSPMVGFAGPNLVQITLEDGAVIEPSAQMVAPQDIRNWSPDPWNTFGGRGTLHGIAGNFSGDHNSTEPQVFFPWPEAVPGASLIGHTAEPSAPAGNPSRWRVAIDGVEVRVQSVFRKMVPVRSVTLDDRSQAHVKRNLVTLSLDRDIPLAAAVEVQGPSVGPIDVTRRESNLSEAIHICQIGYDTGGSKKAYVGLWLGLDRNGMHGSTDGALSEETTWRLVDVGRQEQVLTGNLRLEKPAAEPHLRDQNFNGCDIYLADFSALDQPGTYRLEVEGIGASPEFPVAANPYGDALRAAARWYFHKRSGCAISEPHGEGRTRPRNGHPKDGLTVWQSTIRLSDTTEGAGNQSPEKLFARQLTRVEAEAQGIIPQPGAPNPRAWGGWHDAGDWDRRIQHMDAVYQMALAVELFPSVRELDLNLPESGKPFVDTGVEARVDPEDTGDGKTILPDLIHEALWGISLWRRTQGETGAIIGGVEYSRSGIIGSVSWNPLQLAFAYAPEDWAAYHFAHAAAKLGHVIREVCGDQVLGHRLISEASAAWHWAEASGETEFGPDLDARARSVSHIRVASAATLYRATGDPAAARVFEAHNPFLPKSEMRELGTARGVFTFSSLDYVQAAREGRAFDRDITAAIFGWIRQAVRRDRNNRMGRDYGLHSTKIYDWGRGWLRFGPGMNWPAGRFGLAYVATGAKTIPLRQIVTEGMWFALGCNPSNVSFVQGLGHRCFGDPLLLDGRGEPPIPGQISFGVAGGPLHPWEKRRISGAIFPEDQGDWPIYAQIFESRHVAICAEHGVKSNAMEWLFACAMVNDLIKQSQDSD
ncbi:MAG: glycoside hydrolase family 9 protein [Rhodobacteraceae bacterium]|nr:glycoside hydrolase family 9 protein [Paracoccaceae bacterium]